jgi:hypothetical protein
MSDFDIVRLMVAGDKARRTNDAILWNRLEEYINEIEWARVARMISDGNIVVTNEQVRCAFLFRMKRVAREINAKSNEVALRKLMMKSLASLGKSSQSQKTRRAFHRLI